MDVIEYLHGIGAELVGLSSTPSTRKAVLRYVVEDIVPKFEHALKEVRKEIADGNNSAGAEE